MEGNFDVGNKDNMGFTQIKAKQIIDEVSKVVVGQYALIEQMVVVILSGGHILVEGVPGLAKTLAAKVIAKTIKAESIPSVI